MATSSLVRRVRTPATPKKGRLRPPGRRTGYAYIAPFFVLFLAFSLYPWLDTAWVSLHDVRLTTYQDQTWIGLDNYRNLLSNKFFWNAFANTVTIGIISTVPQLCMALGIAHLLNYRMRGRTFFRVAMLMPYATSLAAATVIFLELFNNDTGIINWTLQSLHLPAVDWQGSKWPSQIAVSTIVTWRWTGYNALIYLAGMQSIDTALYEAAAIDGASRWGQFRHVTLPGLRPTIVFTIVVSTIGAAQLFGEPLLYDPTGQPNGGGSNQYQTLGLLMYQQGWTNDRLGLVNWFLHLVHLPAVDWQGSKWPAQIAVSTIVTWRWTGYNALIYLAGMQSIDSTLYEAAAVDGAGRWRQFLHVTLPGLRPTILFTIVVSTIGATQLFGEPLLYHSGKADGGTEGQYQTLGVLMYQQGWVNDRLGLASATAWTMFVIIVIAVAVNLLVARYRTRGGLR